MRVYFIVLIPSSMYKIIIYIPAGKEEISASVSDEPEVTAFLMHIPVALKTL
jgi:hypothetical protein